MFCDSFLAEKMQFLKLLKTINHVTYILPYVPYW